MTVVAACLKFLEGDYDALAILGLGRLAYRLRLRVRFAVMGFELAHVGADEAHNAYFLYKWWLGVVGDQRRSFFHQLPVPAGNTVGDGLHVPAQIFHDLLQGERFGGLRVACSEQQA